MEENDTAQEHLMMDMTQDCVGWDESRNIDLRMLEKSPVNSQGISRKLPCTTPHSSSSIGKVSCKTSSLDGIRRRLENQGTENDQIQSTQPTRRRREKLQQSEREIDGIFSCLEKEEAMLPPDQISPPIIGELTQQAGNGESARPKSIEARSRFQYASKPPLPTSLKARQRRRRRESENFHPNQYSKRQHRTFRGTKNGFELPTANNNNSSMNSTCEDEGGDFAEILKQMHTPQSTSKTSRSPLRTISEDTDPDQPSTDRHVSLKSDSSSNKSDSPCQAKDTAGSFPHGEVNDTRSDYSRDEFNGQSVPTQKLHQMVKSNSSLGTVADSKSQKFEQNTSADTLNMPPPPPTKNHELSDKAPAVFQSISNNSTHVTSTVATKRGNQQDEFGDLELSSVDFGDIDSLLDMQSSQHLTQFATNDKIKPQTQNYGTTQPFTPSVLNKAFVSEPESKADEFGFFPDIDFEALDEVIAKRQTQPAETSEQVLPPAIEETRGRTPCVSNVSFITFSRYRVLKVEEDSNTYTKTLLVAAWTAEMLDHDKEEKMVHRDVRTANRRQQQYESDGQVHLRDEWYYTRVCTGDVFHLCSLSGRKKTDTSALPIVVHSAPSKGIDADDFVVVMHPDLLVTPTSVSETVGCSRRAVLKNRFGSTGRMTKAALLGTMRHELFGICMKEHKFDTNTAMVNAKKIVRRNATGLIGCGMSVEEAEKGVVEVMPSIREFVSQYTRFGDDGNTTAFVDRPALAGHGHQHNIRFVADAVDAVEDPVISPELGLKGNVDATLSVTALTLNDQASQFSVAEATSPENLYMSLELKTGHNQKTQHAHMAQLALYTLMLQVRHGVKINGNNYQGDNSSIGGLPTASSGGVLVYLNEKSTRSVHVSPVLNEIKSLIGQRNLIASEIKRSSRPRGIKLTYQEPGKDSDDLSRRVEILPPPPVELPEVLAETRLCTKCYANRECMLYAATERLSLGSHSNVGIERSHKDLLLEYTGHLNEGDLKYFQHWDRLIDLEADATSHLTTKAWLLESARRESETGESVSALVFELAESSSACDEELLALMVFRRSSTSPIQTPFSSLSLTPGCQVIISTDGTSLSNSDRSIRFQQSSRVRHRMHVVRGNLARVEEDRILVQASRDDLDRVRRLTFHFNDTQAHTPNSDLAECLFRIDKDNISMGIGTTRQNLLNLFTGDRIRQTKKDDSGPSPELRKRLPWIRDIIVRLKAPSFDAAAASSLFSSDRNTISIPGCDLESLAFEYTELNPDQRLAVEKVISAKDYALIQGLPGTGKTSTLSFVARLLAARGNRVLITSYTNTAVDNVVIKLAESGLASIDQHTELPAVIRIGRKSSCHPSVHHILASELATSLDRENDACGNEVCSAQSDGGIHEMKSPSATSLRRVISSARIICTTALSVPKSPLLVEENFDVAVVDEAGQISQPAILGPLMTSDLFVLVGDHLQLPPLVNSEAAEQAGYGISMLKRLADAFPDSISPLTYQYRMNAEICQLSSDAVYDGKLKCANAQVGSQLLELQDFPASLPRPSSNSGIPWLSDVLDPTRSVVFMDTDKLKSGTLTDKRDVCLDSQPGSTSIDALEEKIGGRYDGKLVNRTEATLVHYLINGLISVGLKASEIGVISPFRAQLKVLEDSPSIREWQRQGVELSTIDRYQGRDKPVIIMSFVRSNTTGKAGRLLKDIRRLNVSMTRAKRKLIMVGSFLTLTRGSRVLEPILDGIDRRNQRYILPPNASYSYDIK